MGDAFCGCPFVLRSAIDGDPFGHAARGIVSVASGDNTHRVGPKRRIPAFRRIMPSAKLGSPVSRSVGDRYDGMGWDDESPVQWSEWP